MCCTRTSPLSPASRQCGSTSRSRCPRPQPLAPASGGPALRVRDRPHHRAPLPQPDHAFVPVHQSRRGRGLRTFRCYRLRAWCSAPAWPTRKVLTRPAGPGGAAAERRALQERPRLSFCTTGEHRSPCKFASRRLVSVVSGLTICAIEI